VCRAHSCSIFTFLNNLQTIIQQSPEHCLIVIMGDFNVNILKINLKKNYYISWINSKYNHNLVKTPQKLDLNETICGQMSVEMKANMV
jgi:exonuclease III